MNRHKVSAEAIALAMQVKRNSVYRWLNGKRTPSRLVRKELKRLFPTVLLPTDEESQNTS